MSKNTTPTNISIALIAIMQAVQAIPKDSKNEAQGFRFRGIEACLNHLHPIFAQHGVVCLPMAESIQLRDFVNAKGNKVFAACVTVTFMFTSADGSQLPAKTIGEAYDSGDKAVAKAFSMAFKTMLTQTFLIPTADIADADSGTFSFDAAAAIMGPGAAYEGKTLTELETLRSELMTAGQMPPKELLGKIAGLRADEQDAAAELDKKPKETPKAPEKPAPAKKEPAATKAPAKAATPPPAAEEDPAPGAEPDEFADEQPAPPKKPDIFEYVVKSIANPKYKDKKLGELSREDIEKMRDGWMKPNAEKIALDPAKSADRDALLAALKILEPQWAKQDAAGK